MTFLIHIPLLDMFIVICQISSIKINYSKQPFLMINWLRLSQQTLLTGLDDHGLWLNLILLDDLLQSVCGIFRSGLSGSQINSLSGATECYIVMCCPTCCCWWLLVDPHLESCCHIQMSIRCWAEANSAIDPGHQAWIPEFYTTIS